MTWVRDSLWVIDVAGTIARIALRLLFLFAL